MPSNRERRAHRQAMLAGSLEPKLQMAVRTKPSWDGSNAKTGVVAFENADGAEPVVLSITQAEDGSLTVYATTPFPIDLEVIQ